MECGGLRHIIVHPSVKLIENEAFYKERRQQVTVILNHGLKLIVKWAFGCCTPIEPRVLCT